MGQRRVTDAFVYLSQVADALGTNPAGASRRLKSKGVQAQVLREKGREKKVFLVDEVRKVTHPHEVEGHLHATDFDGEGVGWYWSGTTDAAEDLEIPPSNVVKTLERYGVEHQILTVGHRVMRVFPSEDVERVKRARAAKRGKSRAAA